MLWCSVYLCYYKALLNKARTQVLHCWFVQIFDKDLKCLIYLGYWRTKHWKYLVFEKDAKADTNLVVKLKSKFSAALFVNWISKISHVLSFFCIWMVSFRRTYCYWLSITYFILLRVFRFFLFFSFFLVFLWVLLLAEVLR